jgi:putative ABC transport system substrate-binding protein
LVSLKPDLLVADSTPNVRAAKQATSTIPIVMVGVINPVERGLVPNLAKPGGNVTGLTGPPLTVEGKRLQLLKDAVPGASRVAALAYQTGDATSGFREAREVTARALNVTLQVYNIREPAQLENAFTAMTKAGAEVLFVEAHPFWGSYRQQIIDLAVRHKLPAMYPAGSFVLIGGLMAYEENIPAIYRQLSSYVDKILKGANPGDLPVEQPTKYDLFINLKTAKALGLTIPPSLLMRAEVIE